MLIDCSLNCAQRFQITCGTQRRVTAYRQKTNAKKQICAREHITKLQQHSIIAMHSPFWAPFQCTQTAYDGDFARCDANLIRYRRSGSTADLCDSSSKSLPRASRRFWATRAREMKPVTRIDAERQLLDFASWQSHRPAWNRHNHRIILKNILWAQ